VDEARRLSDAYGLAYMGAKNVIGPALILITYAALRLGPAAGIDTRGALAALAKALGLTGAVDKAAVMAFACTLSTLLFPAVVLGAAQLGPILSTMVRRLGTVKRRGT
jgi:hypothetical protein